MKLLFHSPQFYPSMGGLQHVVQWWAESMTKLGHEVVVSTYTAGADPPGMNYRVLRMPGFFALTEAMRWADLVIMFNVALKQMIQWRLSSTPLFVSHHIAYSYDGSPPTILARLKRWVANNLAVGQCACSKYVAKDYKNCRVVPNPLLWRPGLPPPERQLHSILFVGRLVTDKGVDLLLKAFAMLNVEPNECPFFLTIIGDGPEAPQLQHLAIELGIASRVHFTGSLPTKQVQQRMQAHKVLAVPSRLEPFGLVVLEGLAAGCQVVASRQGGLPEAGGPWASYFESESVEALVNALNLALRQPEVNTAAMQARKAYLSNYEQIASARALEACLQSTLNKN